MNKHVIKRLEEWQVFDKPLLVAADGKIYFEIIADKPTSVFILKMDGSSQLVAFDTGRFSVELPGKAVREIFTSNADAWLYVRNPHQMAPESEKPSFATAQPMQTESDEMRAIRALTRRFSDLQMSNEELQSQVDRANRRAAKFKEREERKEKRQERKEERQEKRKGKADEPYTGSPETDTKGLSDEGQTHDT